MPSVQWVSGSMFKKKDLKIEFVSKVVGLEKIEECIPKPAKHFLPQWWKNMPTSPRFQNQNVKSCPSFPDYFSQGYIIPMWADTILKYDKDNNLCSIDTGLDSSIFQWSVHSNDQFIDFLNPSLYGKDSTFVF